jgi:hypothetical protein
MVDFMTAETPNTRMAAHDNREDFVFGDAAHLLAQPLGFFPQTGDSVLFRLHDHHEKAPQQKGHQPADGGHIVAQFEESHCFAGDFVVKPQGHGTAGGPQQGDDGAGAGNVGHADKKALAEFGRFVPFAVHGVDGHQQRVDGGRHGGVGHDVGQRGGENKTPQVDHAGLFTHNAQHFIGDPAGQPGFGKHQPHHNGAEDKQHAGVHEIFEGIFGRADEEKHLKHPDGQAGHADGDHLEHPPCGGQQKDRQAPFAFRGERKGFSLGIDGVRPGRGIINKDEQQ